MNVRIAGWAMIFLITVLSIIYAGKLIKANDSVDLRCRIIGTRLSGSGRSPYFYKWVATDGDYFLDPNDIPGRKVNGNVVTPAVYSVFYLLAAFRYDTIKILWAVLQYIFVFASLVLLSKKKSLFTADFLGVVIISVCYLCSNIWFYNIERGQIYTFYLFIMSLIFWLYNTQWRYGPFVAGFINAIAIFIRPLMLVFFIAGIVKKDNKWLAGCLCGVVVGFLILFLPAINQWKDYSAAMQEYSNETNGKHAPVTQNRILPVAPEGSIHLQNSTTFRCGGLNTVQYYLATSGIHTDSISLGIAYCLIAAGCCLLFAKRTMPLAGMDDIFLFAFLLYVLAELFIIGHRGGYNQVEWIFAVFLISRKKEVPGLIIAVIIAAVMLENVHFNFFRFQFELAETMLLVVLFYMVMGRHSIKRKEMQPG